MTGIVLLLATTVSCAPQGIVPRELPVGTREQRYRVALIEREARAAAVESDLTLWTRVTGARRLPGVQGRILLAGPDAFRLHIGSAFGTALDLAANGDSLSAWLPSRRAFTQLDAVADSLGVRMPGSFVVRALSGTWRAPEGALAGPSAPDSLSILCWPEAGDSVTLALGSEGLPIWVRIARAGGATIRVEYAQWGGWEGVRWPARLEIADAAESFHLTCRVQRVQFHLRLGPELLRVHAPAGVERVAWSDLKRALGRIAAF